MERETTTFTTDTYTFHCKTYATAKESHAIQAAAFEGAKFEMVNQEPRISDFDPTVEYKIQLETIRQLIAKMEREDKDGKPVVIEGPEKIVKACEDLPQAEFDEVLEAIDGIVAKKKK